MLSVARRIYQAEPPRHRSSDKLDFDLKLLPLRADQRTMRKTGLGEREVIEILTKNYGLNNRLPLGFDDDVAALPLSSREWAVLKTDMLVGSTDIPPGMTLTQAARKSVVATVSDFAAKGIRPMGLMISLGLPPPVKSSTVKQIAAGLSKGANEYGCRIIGGDTGEAKDLIIDCIGFGLAAPGEIMRRDGARPGDVVAVTGRFGKSSGGLRILLARRKDQTRRFPGLVKSVLHPIARLEEGIRLAKTRAVNSSIDSSDGLARSLHEIARLSRVRIHLENIPVARDAETFAREEKMTASDLALYGGEEYEIVVTIDRDKYPGVKKKVRSLIRIGQVKAGAPEVTAKIAGRSILVDPHGWEHFKSGK